MGAAVSVGGGIVAVAVAGSDVDSGATQPTAVPSTVHTLERRNARLDNSFVPTLTSLFRTQYLWAVPKFAQVLCSAFRPDVDQQVHPTNQLVYRMTQ